MITRNKFLIHMLLFSVLFVSIFATGKGPTAAHASGTIAYVAPGGMTTGSCATWASACDLQHALTISASGYSLWVKAGSYYPSSTNNRSDSFTLKTGVGIYGGFAGTESQLSQRNFTTHITVLTGNIGNAGLTSDNSYHVVEGGGANNTGVLDGFTIQNGNANTGSYPDNSGAGMFNSGSSSPTLRNLIFSSNLGDYGCGMFNDSGSSATLTNVTFDGNTCTIEGGGMRNYESSPTMTNVTFHNNSADGGGGMNNDSSSSPTLTNVTFDGNTAVDGAGMYNNGYFSSPTLTNVTFSGNIASGSGGGMFNYVASQPILKNVTFSGNSASDGGAMRNNGLGIAYIFDSIFWNDGTEMSNSAATPAIADSLVAGGCPSGASCSGALLTTDPKLAPLANNGGYTQTMALGAGSPAINAGHDASCTAKDQRGYKRPQGPHCDMGAFEAGIFVNIKSSGGQDGWVLESSENSNHGGSLNSGSSTYRLGDDASKKQSRGVLSFATGALIPDNATVGQVTLRLKKQGITGGGDPVTGFQGFMLDIKKGTFGTSTLQTTDFQTVATHSYGPFLTPLVGGFYTIDVSSGAGDVNKLATNSGLTQVRVRFKKDDDNNATANYLSLFSGNVAASAPVLILQYYLP